MATLPLKGASSRIEHVGYRSFNAQRGELFRNRLMDPPPTAAAEVIKHPRRLDRRLNPHFAPAIDHGAQMIEIVE
jgi:hypothetical protein